MKTKNQTLLSENTLTSRPTDIIAGFPVRPGLFEFKGLLLLFPMELTSLHIPVMVHPVNFFFSTPVKRSLSQFFRFLTPVVSVMSTP